MPTHVSFWLIQIQMLCIISCVLHSIDISTVAIRNIRYMHAVSTNKIANILHFNDKGLYRQHNW